MASVTLATSVLPLARSSIKGISSFAQSRRVTSLGAAKSVVSDCLSLRLTSIRELKAGRRGGNRAMATMVAVGTKLPDAEFQYFDKDGNMQSITSEQLVKGKKVVLFAVPGAFTPTCSTQHLPGFVQQADALKAKGIDTVACISVNDPFVMRAWGEQLGVGDKVLLLADGSAKFTKALGVDLDLSEKGLGIRSRRYSMLADDGEVKVLNLEEGGAFTVSGADEILKVL